MTSFFKMNRFLPDPDTLKTEIRRDQNHLDCILGEIRNYENESKNNSVSFYYRMECKKKLDEVLYPQKQNLINRIQNNKIILSHLIH